MSGKQALKTLLTANKRLNTAYVLKEGSAPSMKLALTKFSSSNISGRLSSADTRASNPRDRNVIKSKSAASSPVHSGLRISSPYHAKQSRTWFDARGFSIPATMLWQ